MSEKHAQLSSEELRTIMRETVHETLTGMGVDVQNPRESQADLKFLRSARETAESVRKKGFIAIAGALIGLVLTAVLIGFKAMFK